MNTAAPTNAELLSRLNAMRADLGKPQLKSWKASRADLELAIETIKPVLERAFNAKVAAEEAAADAAKPDVTICPPGAAKGVKAPKQSKSRVKVSPLKTGLADDGSSKVKTPKAKKTSTKAAAKLTKTGNTITLADIARELNINPKVARAKARRHSKDLVSLKVAQTDGWEFPMTAKAAVVKIMKGS